jgi:hypothetical protein
MQSLDVTVPVVALQFNVPVAEGEDLPQNLRTRMGYLASDCLKAMETALGDLSTASMGRVLHFTADVVCSGGFALWQRFCYEYAIDHIGLASIRIFYYLKARFRDLEAEFNRLPDEDFYRSGIIQRRIAEIMLVLQGSLRRGKAKMPSVPAETHRNQNWLLGSKRAPESVVVRRIFNRSTDLPELAIATNEMLHACTEGAIERALFWMKWTMEEDAALRKETGGGLTSADRGGQKGKNSLAYFLMVACVEAYKELAAKGSVRMNEEIQALVELFKSTSSPLTARRKLDLLVIMLQILVEVPKWKVPAAQPVVKDPTVLARATEQAPTFFGEVLLKAAPRKTIKKVVAPRKKKGGPQTALEQRLAAFDTMMMNIGTGGGNG